jgi:hypothetical protein
MVRRHPTRVAHANPHRTVVSRPRAPLAADRSAAQPPERATGDTGERQPDHGPPCCSCDRPDDGDHKTNYAGTGEQSEAVWPSRAASEQDAQEKHTQQEERRADREDRDDAEHQQKPDASP